MVIFGATGDLAKRKLLPALYTLATESLLPEHFAVVGVARQAMTIDAYFERGLNAWDLAAGELIASEAGAEITAIDGGPAEPGSVLAAPPTLATQLRDLLARAG
jgi:hypothetical protein